MTNNLQIQIKFAAKFNTRIRIQIISKMLNPDPYIMYTGPRPWVQQVVLQKRFHSKETGILNTKCDL
jgi:hypothetical protein